MKRREFLLTSGPVVLSSAGLQSSSRSAVGLEFELKSVPNGEPSNVDSLLVDFNSFRLTPRYLSKSDDMTVMMNLTLDGIDSTEIQTDVPIKTSIDRSDISDDLPFLLDEINTSQSSIDGDIEITIQHSNIGEKSYKQSFSVTDNPLINDLIVYYPMEKGEGEILPDGAGDNLGQISGATWNGSGYVGSDALSFEGTDDIVSVERFTTIDKTQSRTLCGWINTSALDTNRRAFATVTDGVGSQDIVRIESDGKVHYVKVNSKGNSVDISSNAISTSQWYHVVALWDSSNSETRLYLDGSLQETNALSESEADVTDFDLSGVAEVWDGLIDDVRVYDRPLSQKEIEALANRTSTSGSEITESDVPSQSDNGVSRYEFENNGSGDTIPDSWGSNDGTDNTSAGYANGVYGQAKSFDSNGYVDMNNNSLGDGKSNITASAWAYVSSDNTGGIFGRDRSGGSSEDVWELQYSDGPSRWTFRVRVSGTQYPVSSQKNAELEKWTHLVGTYDGNQAQLYINGKLSASDDAMSGSLATESTDTRIGAYADEALPFHGKIDDVRFYEETLKPKEVKKLYHKGGYRIE